MKRILKHPFARAQQNPASIPPQSPPIHHHGKRVSYQALAPIIPATHNEWPPEHCASEPSPFLHAGELPAWALSSTKLMLALVLLLGALPLHAAVTETGAIGLTVRDADRSTDFFIHVLSFEKISEDEASGAELEQLHGVFGAHQRTVFLKLGAEQIELTEYLTPRGREIPADSHSYDRWFQHLAIVVSDMEKAYAELRCHKIQFVSSEPQTLPAWNKNAAGIKAFYFKDPDDHVLEIIWFPPGKGNPKWQQPTGKLFLGIDHTAIVVSDTEKSLAFYRDALGLKVAGESENYGTEQEHLNQVFGAHLRITALRAAKGPGIEFLEYLSPGGGRDLPSDAQANDLIFWRTHLKVSGEAEFAKTLRAQKTRFVSSQPGGRSTTQSLIVRDPDGHALQLDEPMPVQTSSKNK